MQKTNYLPLSDTEWIVTCPNGDKLPIRCDDEELQRFGKWGALRYHMAAFCAAQLFGLTTADIPR